MKTDYWRQAVVWALWLAGMGLAMGAGETPQQGRKDLSGAIGPTWPIVEPDMLQEIMSILEEKERNGDLARLQEEAISRSLDSAQNPRPVEGLVKATHPRSWYFDPTIVSNQRITTPDGIVLVEKGQRLNPLDQMAMTKWLVFFDARDPAQVRKAAELVRQAAGKAKPILVAGSYIELQKQWKSRVYFDQSGTLVRKFGIRQVPAVVYQEGNRLRIDEIVAGDAE